MIFRDPLRRPPDGLLYLVALLALSIAQPTELAPQAHDVLQVMQQLVSFPRQSFYRSLVVVPLGFPQFSDCSLQPGRGAQEPLSAQCGE